ncbi:hypothetical protein QE152_g10464 [Popillia japonica]|uniref:Uncharacterized protein n=1 Tax=Popillia japonica TaxID=7064 RepID=A0AAW1LV33_POPJA
MVAKILHQELFIQHVPEARRQPYYAYIPENIVETQDVKLYWARVINTDKPVPSNIPDIVLVDKKERHTFIIDIAIPNAANLSRKHKEKITKYLPLAIEIKVMQQTCPENIRKK